MRCVDLHERGRSWGFSNVISCRRMGTVFSRRCCSKGLVAFSLPKYGRRGPRRRFCNLVIAANAGTFRGYLLSIHTEAKNEGRFPLPLARTSHEPKIHMPYKFCRVYSVPRWRTMLRKYSKHYNPLNGVTPCSNHT